MERKLKFRTPAGNWQREGLPVGNGFMGAMISGGISSETIQYNEKTAWDGGPIDGNPDIWNGGNRDGAAEHLPEIRRMLREGKKEEALTLGNETLTGIYENASGAKIGAYQAFGAIEIDSYAIEEDRTEEYIRELNLEDGICRVSFRYANTVYEREYFCSYPDRVFAVRLTCTGGRKLQCRVRSTLAHPVEYAAADTGNMLLRGRIQPNQLLLESQLRILTDGCSEVCGKETVAVRDAEYVILLLACATNYENRYPGYRGADPHERLDTILSSALKKGYEELKAGHIRDYQALFQRVELEVPGNSEEALLFDYGRYLLIASSREGSLPANLQGVWNASNQPPWRSDYHFNINIQMNYWPAFSANLSECALPLLEYIEKLREPGRITAKTHFGVSRGWCVNCANDIFGYTAPGNKMTYGWAPNSNAFICMNLWEFYCFTQDRKLLETRIYPILKEAAEFWLEWLTEEEDGSLVSVPSYSPEQGDLSCAAAMDQQLAYLLFSEVIQASGILQKDQELREELIQARKKISSPVRIGRYGQIQEWREDIDDERTNAHRHNSQLTGLYPGDLITERRKEWCEAARVTLLAREQYTTGSEVTGWSIAWRMLLWSRLGNGEKVQEMIHRMMENSIYENFLDHCDGPFQIDGNFGYTAGIAESLLQSHENCMELLPALPSEWKCGKFSGLMARGAYEVRAVWRESMLDECRIFSEKEGICRIRKNEHMPEIKKIINVGDGSEADIAFDREQKIYQFHTGQKETWQLIWEQNSGSGRKRTEV